MFIFQYVNMTSRINYQFKCTIIKINYLKNSQSIKNSYNSKNKKKKNVKN